MGAVEQSTGVVSYNDQKVEIRRGELSELRRRAAYYQAQFEIRKRKTKRLLDFCRKMKAERKKLWRRLFGKKSESKNNSESKQEGNGGKRGKKPGAKGHGRTPVEGLPTTTEQIDLAEDKNPHFSSFRLNYCIYWRISKKKYGRSRNLTAFDKADYVS